MKKIILLFFLILIPGISQAACDDPLTDGVDYTNCRFSDGQDLQGSYLPNSCLLYTSPSPRDLSTSRMPSSA